MSKIENPENRYLNLLQFILGILWLKSCYGKFISNDFIDNIAKTLIFFSSKNPVGWYKAFLVNTAIPYAHLFAELSRWGELTGGVLLVLTSVYSLYNYQSTISSLLAVIGLLIVMNLNFNFGLASYWTSPANETLNLLMFLVELIILIYQFKRILSIHSHD
ncbi:hypothetical protein A3D03_01320 [Candidatus Gottesmanbacteria bacterium RIFCSPHIGHO2_02_FULL_40_13]|uniref:DoxX family protein n=1 Tax=Candidatus Gottesmanbacteria bacterium RIFCSPHIGHO2_02_FULL_40_13 TaxID=1798384 RepID=A0A1F6AAF5_9BACT|nr:MAG: hypothetical protein A3D03_01320 [Candidatus Gottesmanbacteria bacterium RIFCSPHIGHO2_02_FULL_40_13]